MLQSDYSKYLILGKVKTKATLQTLKTNYQLKEIDHMHFAPSISINYYILYLHITINMSELQKYLLCILDY